MSDDRVVHVIERGRDDERIHATVSTFKGTLYVSLRIFFKGDAGTWLPTKRGITIAAEQLGELETAIAALRTAVDAEPKCRPDRVDRYIRERRPA